MILSDGDIKKRIANKDLEIDNYDEKMISPASLDVRLGSRLRVFKQNDHHIIDPVNYKDVLKSERTTESGVKVEDYEYTTVYDMTKPFVIHPYDFVLGSTLENFKLPNDLAARLDGRSSLGRLGLITHATAGWIDPGFHGNITLEITNFGKLPIMLHIGMRIGQLIFYQLSSPAEIPYNLRKLSKYHDQKGATQSKLNEDFEFDKPK